MTNRRWKFTIAATRKFGRAVFARGSLSSGRLPLSLGHCICMKRIAALLLLFSGLSLFAADDVSTNLVVTPSEVDASSVSLTAKETRQPNLTFNYLSKTPEQIKAIHRRHPPVWVLKDGEIVAKAIGCAGYKGRRAPDGQLVFSGLVLGFEDLEQARIAERVLKREDKKPR